MNRLLVLPLLLSALSAASCSSSTGGSSSGTSGSPTGTPLGGGALDGTWDVTVTTPTGTEHKGTVTISPTLFAMSFGDFDLNGALNNGLPDVTSKNGTRTSKVAVIVNQQTFDTGAFSYPIGGSWTIGDTGKSCAADIKIPTMSLNCPQISLPENVDYWVEGASTAQRTSTLPSSFGELGGTWNVIAPKGNVEVTFQNNVFTAKGFDGGQETGTVTMSFDGGRASGTISDGTEIAANRR